MAYVVTLTEVRPSARFDGFPWVEAHIEEAVDSDGPWMPIDTQVLSPVDADPADPATRNFTTNDAMLPAGWYRVVFVDAEDATQASASIYVSDAPTSPYFTIAEARKIAPLSDETAYPDSDIESTRRAVEEALEHACRVAFVPRIETETHSGDGTGRLRLGRYKVRELVSAAHDDEPLDISAVRIEGRTLYSSTGWPTGRANLEVVYQHGFDAPPSRIKRAALRLTKHFLVESGINDQATRAEAGEERLWLATPEPFGIPEVDAAVRDYKFVTVEFV